MPNGHLCLNLNLQHITDFCLRGNVLVLLGRITSTQCIRCDHSIATNVARSVVCVSLSVCLCGHRGYCLRLFVNSDMRESICWAHE